MTSPDLPLLEHSLLELTSGLLLEPISLLFFFTLVSWLLSRKCPDPRRPGEEPVFVPRAACFLSADHWPPRPCRSAHSWHWFSISRGIKNSQSPPEQRLPAWLHVRVLPCVYSECQHLPPHPRVTEQLCGKCDSWYLFPATATVLIPT